MSLLLQERTDNGIVKDGVQVSARQYSEDEGLVVVFGDREVPLEEFLIAAAYVLGTVALKQNDPRLQFVKCVESMRVIREADGEERLKTYVPPVPVRTDS
jgi:hypothetical protein